MLIIEDAIKRETSYFVEFDEEEHDFNLYIKHENKEDEEENFVNFVATIKDYAHARIIVKLLNGYLDKMNKGIGDEDE